MSTLTKRTKRTLINSLKPIQTLQTEPPLTKQSKSSSPLHKKNAKKKPSHPTSTRQGGLAKYTESQHNQRQSATVKKGVMIDRKAD